MGDPDGDDIASPSATRTAPSAFSGLPDGTFRITVVDQWNDQIVDGLGTGGGAERPRTTMDVGDIAVLQWHTKSVYAHLH
ncbi:hypothetical protein ACFOPS_04710 [Ralstonia solanacearum]|uniref:hypothetical protein n=1 Tax=Ralstonia solanacearum TaxID=305 RepID=UPI0036150656